MYLVIGTDTGNYRKEAFEWIGRNRLRSCCSSWVLLTSTNANLSTSTLPTTPTNFRNQLQQSQSKSNGAKVNCCVWVWEQLEVFRWSVCRRGKKSNKTVLGTTLGAVAGSLIGSNVLTNRHLNWEAKRLRRNGRGLNPYWCPKCGKVPSGCLVNGLPHQFSGNAYQRHMKEEHGC